MVFPVRTEFRLTTGYSTGPHVHVEIHQEREWTPHAERVDLKDFFPTQWEEHMSEIL